MAIALRRVSSWRALHAVRINFSYGGDKGSMSYEARREVVRSFLEDTGLAMKPTELYRNLRYHEQITFSKETVKNILRDLAADGEIKRVDRSSLDDGTLVELTPGEGRGVYIATSAIPDHDGGADTGGTTG